MEIELTYTTIMIIGNGCIECGTSLLISLPVKIGVNSMRRRSVNNATNQSTRLYLVHFHTLECDMCVKRRVMAFLLCNHFNKFYLNLVIVCHCYFHCSFAISFSRANNHKGEQRANHKTHTRFRLAQDGTTKWPWCECRAECTISIRVTMRSLSW